MLRQPDGIPKYLYHFFLFLESALAGERHTEDDDNISPERHSRYYKFLYLFAQLSFAVFI